LSSKWTSATESELLLFAKRCAQRCPTDEVDVLPMWKRVRVVPLVRSASRRSTSTSAITHHRKIIYIKYGTRFLLAYNSIKKAAFICNLS